MAQWQDNPLKSSLKLVILKHCIGLAARQLRLLCDFDPCGSSLLGVSLLHFIFFPNSYYLGKRSPARQWTQMFSIGNAFPISPFRHSIVNVVGCAEIAIGEDVEPS